MFDCHRLYSYISFIFKLDKESFLNIFAKYFERFLAIRLWEIVPLCVVFHTHRVNPSKAWCPQEGHTYLNKPAAESCGFV